MELGWLENNVLLLPECPEVVVATPGRLWDLISMNHPHLSNLSSLRFMIIDEADKMVKQGNFKVEAETALSWIV